jgi:Uma2 family endonuclease
MELLIEEEKYTVEDFRKMENLDENHYYELIDGEIISRELEIHNSIHDKVATKLFWKLSLFALKNKLGTVFRSPVNILINTTNLFQPDLSFISSKNEESTFGENDLGIPNLVVEVLIPEKGMFVRGKKKKIYEQNGIQEYWIVDLMNQIIEVYVIENKRFILHSYCLEKEKVVSKLFKELDLSGEEIFV